MKGALKFKMLLMRIAADLVIPLSKFVLLKFILQNFTPISDGTQKTLFSRAHVTDL